MRSGKSSVVGTYRVTARTTAQAIKIAEEYRRKGWRCTSRGKRIVLTTYEEAFLSPITAVLIWQVDRSSHDEACRQWLVPELRGRRRDPDDPDESDGHPADIDNHHDE